MGWALRDRGFGTGTLGCILWDGCFGMGALGCMLWDMHIGMGSSGWTPWDACFGTCMLGWALWNERLGMCTLGCGSAACEKMGFLPASHQPSQRMKTTLHEGIVRTTREPTRGRSRAAACRWKGSY